MHQLGVRREGNRLLHGRVSMTTCRKSAGLAAPHAGHDGQALLDQLDELVLPMCWRQRVSDERSNGSCWQTSPQNSW
jgi:hypothetical protein